MSNEIKVGSRVIHKLMGNGVVESGPYSLMSARYFTVLYDSGVRCETAVWSLTLIPDIVTIELSRKTVEYFGRAQRCGVTYFDQVGGTCRKALGMEDA